MMNDNWGMGWVPQLVDPRDDLHSFQAPVPVAAALPQRYWPIDRLPKLKYQGNLGSCVSHGVRFSIVAADMAIGVNTPIDPSRLHIYWHGREIQNTIQSDSGLSIRNGIKAVVSSGYCPEPLWPYDINRFKERPPTSAETEGMRNRVIKYQSVPQEMTSIKAAIVTNEKGDLDLEHPRPVPFGFTCYQSISSQSTAQSGDIPNPGVFDAIAGGHCIDICGWDDARQRVLVANWWDGWGVNGGYGTMSYSYLLSQLASDFWRIISVPIDDQPLPPSPTPAPVGNLAALIAALITAIKSGEWAKAFAILGQIVSGMNTGQFSQSEADEAWQLYLR